MFRRVAAFLGLALLAVPCLAQHTYAQRLQNIRAGVLTLDATRYGPGQPPANDNPFVWLNVDSNSRVKPAGWNFYNPLAPGVVDQTIYNRWNAIMTYLDPANTYARPVVGEQIDKRKAPYWEVRLS